MNLEETIKKIRLELNGYANLELVEEKNTVSVMGDSFKVELVIEQKSFLLNLGNGWFIRSRSLSLIMDHFIKALSTECRLVEFYRGKFYQSSRLEQIVEGEWELISSTFRPFYPFWRKETSLILQNNLVRNL